MMKSVVVALVLTSSLASSHLKAQQQPPGPGTIGFLNGTEFILERPYTYVIGSTRTSITIPAGFVTDFASIPLPLRGILQTQAQYSRAALIHDYLYWAQRCSRVQSDNLLLIAMKESNVSPLQRGAVYRGVRAGGSAAWRNNARERQAGSPRVVPQDMYNLADHNSWSQARAILKARNIKDPPFSIDPAACALGNSTRIP